MIRCLLAALATTFLIDSAVLAAGNDIVARYKAVFSSPPKNIPSNSAVDAPLMGNGDLLVALGGKADKLQFYINKNDLWVMRDDHDSRPQPLARIDVDLPEMQGASYRVEQDLVGAITIGQFKNAGKTVSLETGVAATENLLWVKLTVTGGAVSGKANLLLPGQTDEPGAHRVRREQISRGIYKMAAPCAEVNMLGAGGVQVVERRFDKDVMVPAGAACALRVMGEGESFMIRPGQPVLIVAAVCGLADQKDIRAAAVARAMAFTAEYLTGVRVAHQAWWREFWSKSFVEIPDKLLEQRYYLSHYGMACASRLRGFPPGLFGWNTTDTPSWNGDYHMNYNLVAPFYGLYAANHIEQANPCNDAILDSLESSREFCRRQLGIEGVIQRTALGPKGSLAHPGNHGQKSHSSYSCVPLAMTWYATYDLDFARRTYPFVRGVAEFWENYLTVEEGRYVIYKDSAHEVSGEDKNPIVSLALVKMVMSLALDMSTDLGVDAGRHAKWKHIRDHISGYPTCTVRELASNPGTGQAKFIWPGHLPKTKAVLDLPIFRYTERGTPWYVSNTVGIQHVYPAGGIGLDSSLELLERSRNQIRVLGRWRDFNGMNSFYAAGARVGYDPGIILKELHNTMARIGAANGMIIGNPHGMEHFSIVLNAIQEMLLQSHEGVIRFFPCWPKDQNARFGTLRARGAFLVSAELKNGKVSSVKIISEKGRDCTVQNPWPGKRVCLAGRETLAGERFAIKTTPNETIEMRPE